MFGRIQLALRDTTIYAGINTTVKWTREYYDAKFFFVQRVITGVDPDPNDVRRVGTGESTSGNFSFGFPSVAYVLFTLVL